MADAGGALEQQQGIAARIPYENIGLTQSSIGQALGAWGMATQLKQKQIEIGDRMRALVLRNNQLQFMDEFNQEKFNRTLALKEAEATQRANQSAFIDAVRLAQLGTARDALQLRSDEFDRRERDKQDIIEGTQGAMSELSNIDVSDPNSESSIFNTLSKYKLPASLYRSLSGQALARRKNYWDQEDKAIDTEEKNIQESVSGELFGQPSKRDVSPLFAQDRFFVQNYAIKGGGKKGEQIGAPDPHKAGDMDDPATGKPYKFKTDPQGNLIPTPYKSFKVADPNDPSKTNYKPVAVRRMQDYMDRLKVLEDRRTRLGNAPHHPELGIVDNKPTDKDIETLKNHPELRRRFEARFGVGSASQYGQ